MKKLIPLFLVLALLLSACGSKVPETSEYPVTAPLATDGLSLAEASVDDLTFSYPDEIWLMDEASTPLTFYYAESLDAETGFANINVQVSVPCSSALTEKDLADICDDLRTQGLTLSTSELRTLNGTVFIYTESVLQFTDDLIDTMLDTGILTEESLNALGGREVLLSIPSSPQVAFYIPIDGNLIIFTGTYFNAEEKQAVCDAITIMAQTGKVPS